jgi:hypothetical protein
VAGAWVVAGACRRRPHPTTGRPEGEEARPSAAAGFLTRAAPSAARLPTEAGGARGATRPPPARSPERSRPSRACLWGSCDARRGQGRAAWGRGARTSVECGERARVFCFSVRAGGVGRVMKPVWMEGEWGCLEVQRVRGKLMLEQGVCARSPAADERSVERGRLPGARRDEIRKKKKRGRARARACATARSSRGFPTFPTRQLLRRPPSLTQRPVLEVPLSFPSHL